MSKRTFRAHTDLSGVPSSPGYVEAGGHVAYTADGVGKACPCSEFWVTFQEAGMPEPMGHDAATGELLTVPQIAARKDRP